MKKWKIDRNYRRVKDENGKVIANVITVDGIDVEVSDEVFFVYAQADRRERYIAEEVEPRKVLSLDQLLEDHIPLEKLGVKAEISVEESALQRANHQKVAEQIARLQSALTSLTEEEHRLVQALFFDGVSVREYARQTGVYHHAVAYQRDKVLEKLRRKIFS